MPSAVLSFSSSLIRHSFLSFLSKTLTLTPRNARYSLSLKPSIKHLSSTPKVPKPKLRHRPMTTTTTTTAPFPQNPNPNPKPSKKSRREAPESVLRHALGQCSKSGDLAEALRLYDAARAAAIPLSIHHFNSLLYLCSLPSNSHSPLSSRGFEIFHQMKLDSIPPNEATFTAAARLAAAVQDPDLAFDLVKEMQNSGIPPKLRSYAPALFGFCQESKPNPTKAHEVEAHMAANGILPEEPELAALLKMNSQLGRGDEVYRILHRMRSLVRRVSEETVGIVENWFGSAAAEEVGNWEWSEEEVREGVRKGGGGWHGVGWLGQGKWSVGRSEMDGEGVCTKCGERLVCIDIDPVETEEFARSLASLASQREVRADFVRFQEWLDRNGPFDAVVDGANVGIYNQHNFSFFQLNSVVNGLRQMSTTKKLPLIVLHNRRVKGGPADNPNNKKLLESWRRAGALYATPVGSNDDWYWLYAAVSCRSLLVTNDEMRDHLFELLGTSFFPRWKEKHQVRLTFSKGPNFHMPPPYSIVIQESERGSWHIPTVSGDDIETPRQWVCATRDAKAVLSPSEGHGPDEIVTCTQ